MNSLKWSYSEERLLSKLYNKGASYRQIIEALETELNSKRTHDALARKISNMGLLRKYQQLTEGKKLGHLDIESSQLNASFGMIISWAIKVDGKRKILGDRLTEADFAQTDKLDTDKRIVKSLVDTMQEFDVITHFFGDYFDVPFIRSRCLKHGLEFPEYGSIHTVDVWKWTKRNMKLHSSRLESVAEHLGVNSKTKLRPTTWIRGTMGDMKAIDEIYEHNRQDVITLEKVYHRLKPFSNGSRRSI